MEQKARLAKFLKNWKTPKLMLEVTLIKIEHSGLANAKLLLPHILKCNVYGGELAHTTRKIAEKREDAHETRLKSSRAKNTALWEKEKPTIWRTRNCIAYLQKENDYLFRNRIPLWHTERYEGADIDRIKEFQDTLQQLSIQEGAYYQIGDVDACIDTLWTLHKVLERCTLFRDRHIAATLSTAEEDIRERYPALADLETIKYVITLGNGHALEHVTDFPIRVIELGSPIYGITLEVHESLRAGKTRDESRELLEQYAHMKHGKSRAFTQPSSTQM